MTARRALGLLAGAWALVCASIARAEPPIDPPPDAMAWWSLEGEASTDPAPILDAIVALAAAPESLPNDDALAVLLGPARAAMASLIPVRLTLLDAEAESGLESTRLARVQVIVEFPSRPGLTPESIGEAVQTRLPDAIGVASGAYRNVRVGSWPPDRAIAWTERDSRVVIGVGAGALDRWFAPREERVPAWSGLRSACKLPPAQVVAEGFVNLNEVRARSPEFLARGPARRYAEALRVSNLRAVLLRATRERATGSVAPPTGLEVAWSSRNEPPDRVKSVVLAQQEWPAGWTPAREPIALVAGTNPAFWLTLATSIRRAPLAEWERIEFDTITGGWRRAEGAAFDRVLARLAPRMLVEAPPGSPLSGGSVRVPFLFQESGPAADRAARDLVRDFTRVIDSLGARAQRPSPDAPSWRLSFGSWRVLVALDSLERPSMLVLALDDAALARALAAGSPRPTR